MLSSDEIATLRRQLANVIADELTDANIDWACFAQLNEPRLHIEAQIQARLSDDGNARQKHGPLPGLVISQVIDLTKVVPPRFATSRHGAHTRRDDGQRYAEPTSGIIVPLSSKPHDDMSHCPPGHGANTKEKRQVVETDPPTPGSQQAVDGNGSRTAISGLRPIRRVATVVEDDTQRQMQVLDENFPKRRKAEAVGYALKPSTLDKLIIGIWEQLHTGLGIDPVALLGQFVQPPVLDDAAAPKDMSNIGLSLPLLSRPCSTGVQFNDTTIFCRKVTQASRTCRSVEVVVQARWIEYFDAYVEHMQASDPKTSHTKHRKAALVEASANFGWSEKDLRNKMAIWRGYKEIKDTGGWVALVFAGMGIYRFCKYRIGFDKDSMQRLRNLRPALEVAADTMNPGWRRLLFIVGESTQRLYSGHPHDWVVDPDGSPPVPLRQTYLQWDPDFEYRHIEESVMDQAVWGSEDPRWKPPSSGALMRVSNLPLCEVCSQEQSDDPKLNCCYCFPSLFGCATPPPPPVQVFRTRGRNNGLMALCAFERGAAIGEFVGVITKGLSDVDVMESTVGARHYQIWQGREGNFTRFVNHSCNANSQYQRFTWLNTQRIILVSKGIEAGSEITVDYSENYWKGLDKKCLCGERSCRYRRER
ncbi:hypothetical protein GGS20DRAFT_576512 [Poronia punctata]|nr:hypothetical protein GGS20DRAFT_576512 [Poronia punctata]